MKTVLAAIIILGIGVIGMCFNIIFRKNGKFPETEISHNENMRKMGIKCMREQDEEIFSKKEAQKERFLHWFLQRRLHRMRFL